MGFEASKKPSKAPGASRRGPGACKGPKGCYWERLGVGFIVSFCDPSRVLLQALQPAYPSRAVRVVAGKFRFRGLGYGEGLAFRWGVSGLRAHG